MNPPIIGFHEKCEASELPPYEAHWKGFWDSGGKLQFQTRYSPQWIDLVQPTFDPDARVTYRHTPA